MASDVVFSPAVFSLRLVALRDASESTIHRGIVWAAGTMMAAVQFSAVAHRLGAERNTTILLQLVFIILLLVLAVAQAIIRRNKIREYFIATSHLSGTLPG
jgi:hypothetical protein